MTEPVRDRDVVFHHELQRIEEKIDTEIARLQRKIELLEAEIQNRADYLESEFGNITTRVEDLDRRVPE